MCPYQSSGIRKNSEAGRGKATSEFSRIQLRITQGGEMMMQRLVTIACGGLLFLAASRSFAADESLPPGATISSIEAQPAAIELKNRFEYAQVLLTATTAAGDRIDATRLAKPEKSADVVEVSPTGLIRPKADGKAEITFSLGERSVVLPVTVTGNGGDYKVSFVQDVMPTISK